MSAELPHTRSGFFMQHIANPIMRRLGLFPVLAVRDRQSGEPRPVPIGEPLAGDQAAP